MRCNHIVSRLRTDTLCDQCCHTGDKSVNHNRHTESCSTQKHTCHTGNIESSDLCQYIDCIFRIRPVDCNCFFDCMYLTVQSVSGKTCTASRHFFSRTVQKHRCYRTAGRRISDSHFSRRQKAVTVFFQTTHHFNACLQCLHCLFSCHGRLLCHICCSTCNFQICRYPCIYCHTDIDWNDFGSALSAHHTRRGISGKEIFRNAYAIMLIFL